MKACTNQVRLKLGNCSAVFGKFRKSTDGIIDRGTAGEFAGLILFKKDKEKYIFSKSSILYNGIALPLLVYSTFEVFFTM